MLSLYASSNTRPLSGGAGSTSVAKIAGHGKGSGNRWPQAGSCVFSRASATLVPNSPSCSLFSKVHRAGIWLTLPSRGCPKGCAFCAPLMSNVRRRKPRGLVVSSEGSVATLRALIGFACGPRRKNAGGSVNNVASCAVGPQQGIHVGMRLVVNERN
jgi:hypothetical protein